MSINNPRNPLKPSGSSSSGGPLEIYSTDERRIGTWIDGKPLYRKVVQGTISSTSNSRTIIATIPDVENVPKCSGYATYQNGDITIIPTGFEGGATIQVICIKGIGTFNVAVYNSTSSLRGCACLLIVEYTKTTDQTEG